MWKATLSKAVKEVRFILKPGPDHHGVWHFVGTKLPDIRKLNPSTYFQVQELSDQFTTESACHIIYGDADNTEERIFSKGMTPEKFEEALKAKVLFGMTLDRPVPKNNTELEIPVDIVQTHKYVKHIDDAF